MAETNRKQERGPTTMKPKKNTEQPTEKLLLKSPPPTEIQASHRKRHPSPSIAASDNTANPEQQPDHIH